MKDHKENKMFEADEISGALTRMDGMFAEFCSASQPFAEAHRVNKDLDRGIAHIALDRLPDNDGDMACSILICGNLCAADKMSIVDSLIEAFSFSVHEKTMFLMAMTEQLMGTLGK